MQGAKVAAAGILPEGGWVLGAAGARLYRRSVKRWYWVLVCVLVELLMYYTTYILKLARYLDAARATRCWFYY